MINLFSNYIVREIVDEIRANGVFGVMIDGTQDITGKEQECICIRHVDSELEVHEHFIGLYELIVTTGENIAKMLNDVIIRLNLSFDQLRAQTYDGAANMSGIYNGCQAKVREIQSLALFFIVVPIKLIW